MVESGDVDKNKKLPESETDMSIFYWLIFESDVDTLNTQDIWLLVVLDYANILASPFEPNFCLFFVIHQFCPTCRR